MTDEENNFEVPNVWRAWSVTNNCPIYVVAYVDMETGFYYNLVKKKKLQPYKTVGPYYFYQCKFFRKENSAFVAAGRAFGYSSLEAAELTGRDSFHAGLIEWSLRPRIKQTRRKRKKNGGATRPDTGKGK